MSDRRYKNPQVNLRVPDETKRKISELAGKNNRSLNAEINAAIEAWLALDEQLDKDAMTLESRIKTLEEQMLMLLKDK